MTSKPYPLSYRLFRVFSAIVLIPLFWQGASASAHTPPPQIVTSPKQEMGANPCPTVWRGLIERFIITSSQSPLPARPRGAQAGRRMRELPRFHVPLNTPITDKTNPPSSGSHYDCTAPWGIYEKAPADGFLVHNLEHGTVIISYNPNRIQGQTLEQLRTQARELSLTNARLILTPRPQLNTAIALTAWGYLKKLERYESIAVKAFYESNIARAPECEDGRCPDW